MVVVAVTAAVGFFVWRWADRTNEISANDSATHEAYADLYQAAWRMDDGRGEATISATLFTPRLTTLLLADTQRSAVDAQVAPLVENLAATAVPVLVSMAVVANSPTAKIADTELEASLTMTAPGYSFQISQFKALIAPSVAATNSGTSTMNRMWLIIFRADQVVDWTKIHDLQLKISGIGGITTRTYTWAQPFMLNVQ